MGTGQKKNVQILCLGFDGFSNRWLFFIPVWFCGFASWLPGVAASR